MVPHEVLAALKAIRELQARSATEPSYGLHVVVWSWATLEKCLLGVLQEQRVTQSTHALRELTTSQLISEAMAHGLITKEDSLRLRSSSALRNELAHGQSPSATLDSQLVDEAVDAVVQAINHLYASVAGRSHPLHTART